MKYFEQSPEQDNKVVAAEVRHVKESELIGRMRPHPGHRVFEFELATGMINEAVIETSSAAMPGSYKQPQAIVKKIIQRPDCLYCHALNKQNSVKKFMRMYDRLVKEGKLIRKAVEA